MKKKIKGVFENFSTKQKFQKDFTDKITDELFKNNNISYSINKSRP
jgi:hypothetical protein